MSLLSRLFKSKAGSPGRASSPELVETVGLLLLAVREKRDDSLRHSARLGELLGLLWQEDAQAIQAVYDAFASVERVDRKFVETLGQRLRARQPLPPSPPESRYEAVVHALKTEIEALPAQFLPYPQRFITTEVGSRLLNALTLARILMPPELHAPVCELLIALDREGRARQDEEASTELQSMARESIYRFLASLSPEAIPTFWALLRQESVSEEFWPALRRIRDIRALPSLLELLPAVQDEQGQSVLSISGQKEVIQVLREIGDLRAVPALLAIEKRPLPPPVEKAGIQSAWDRALSAKWRERNDLARVAGQAARHILRNSEEAEAQLLRASDFTATHGETLVRPARPQSGATASGELMRPSEESESTKSAYATVDREHRTGARGVGAWRGQPGRVAGFPCLFAAGAAVA